MKLSQVRPGQVFKVGSLKFVKLFQPGLAANTLTWETIEMCDLDVEVVGEIKICTYVPYTVPIVISEICPFN